MKKAIDGPRAEASSQVCSRNMPKSIRRTPTVIRMIIGPGGKNIKAITAATGASVDIEDSAAASPSSPPPPNPCEQAKELVQYYDQRPDLGKNYMGKVRQSAGNRRHCGNSCPMSKPSCTSRSLIPAAWRRLSDVAHLGEDMLVKVIEINGDRIRASRKAVLLEEQGIEWKPEDTARPARAPRGEGDRDHPR